MTMNELFFSIIICVVTVVLLAVHQSYSTTGPVWHWCPSWHVEHCCMNRAGSISQRDHSKAKTAKGEK